MKTFNDTQGREWILDLNFATVKSINARLQKERVDLLKPNTLIHRLADPVFCADVLYLFVKDQADKLEINAEEFGKSLGGAVVWDAQQKLMEEYIDFFPNPGVQETLRKQMQKTLEYSERIMKMVQTRLSKMDAEFDQAMADMEKAMDAQIDKTMSTLGESFTNLPEPPESETSTDLPPDNSATSPSDANSPNGTDVPSSPPSSPTATDGAKKGTKSKTSTPTPTE